MGLEIERKWLVIGTPILNKDWTHSVVYQVYPYCEKGIDTVVMCMRATMKVSNNEVKYFLTVKGSGTLIREEYDIEISSELYHAFLLSEMSNGRPPIIKNYYTYMTKDGFKIELSCVDCDINTAFDNRFIYVEVEFESEEEAKRFDESCIAYLLGGCELKDVTVYSEYKMASYWYRTRVMNNEKK